MSNILKEIIQTTNDLLISSKNNYSTMMEKIDSLLNSTHLSTKFVLKGKLNIYIDYYFENGKKIKKEKNQLDIELIKTLNVIAEEVNDQWVLNQIREITAIYFSLVANDALINEVKHLIKTYEKNENNEDKVSELRPISKEI